jgi:hypothetical protein
MTESVCRTCTFAREHPQAQIPDVRIGAVLQCHRYPPAVSILPGANGGTVTVSDYPSTLPTGWCGEYRKADYLLSRGSS